MLSVKELGALLIEHENYLYAAARSHVRSWEDIEDLKNDLIVWLLSRRHTYLPGTPFKRWLSAQVTYGINARAGWYVSRYTDLPESAAPNLRPEPGLEDDFTTLPVWYRLSVEQRMIVRCLDKGMSLRETARHLAGTREDWVSRRLAEIRRIYKEYVCAE